MEAQEKMIRITVIIAGRPYPLKISPKDEPVVRRVVKQLNDKINQFQRAYKKDKQDLLAMTLLTYGMELHKTAAEKASKNTSNLAAHSFSESIEELDDLVEAVLASVNP